MKNRSTLFSTLSTRGIPFCSFARLGQGYASDMAFCPENGVVAVTTSEGVWWHKLPTLSPVALWEKEGGTRMFSCCTFSNNGQLFAAGGLDGAKVWDVMSGECLVELARSQFSMREKQNIDIDSLAFSPNGHLLAAAAREGDTCIDVWLSESGERIARFEIENQEDVKESIYECTRTGPLVFSTNSQLLACGLHKFSRNQDGAVSFISIWNVDTGAHVAHIPVPKPVHSLSFSPCGQFLSSGNYAGTVQVWTVGDWDVHRVYPTYGDYCMYVAYSSEGFLRAAGISREQRITTVWDIENGDNLYNYPGDVDLLLDFPKGSQICFVSDQKLNVWKIENEKHAARHSYITHIPFSISLVFAADQKTLVLRDFHTGISLWNVDIPHQFPHVFKPTDALWFSVDMSSSGKILATSADKNNVTLWEVGNDTPLELFTTEAKVKNVAFSPTASVLACLDENAQIYLWNTQSGCLHETVQAEYSEAERMIFSPNGRYLVSGTDLLYDVEKGEKIEAFDLDEMAIHLFSHDSTQFFCDTREAIELWDIHQRKKVISFPKPETWGCSDVVALALSLCGKYLAGSCGEAPEELHLWAIEGGKPLTVFKGNAPILALTFSPDSTFLASGMDDGTILLWDLKPYLKNI